MPTYTICSRVIKVAAEHEDYLLDILFRLISERRFKISLDSQKKVISLYGKIAANSAEIKFFLDLITKNSYGINKHLTWVNCLFTGNESEEEIFVIVCKSTVDKIRICNQKEDYLGFNGINLYDKDEIVDELHSAKTIITADNGSVVAMQKSKVKKPYKL